MGGFIRKQGGLIRAGWIDQIAERTVEEAVRIDQSPSLQLTHLSGTPSDTRIAARSAGGASPSYSAEKTVWVQYWFNLGSTCSLSRFSLCSTQPSSDSVQDRSSSFQPSLAQSRFSLSACLIYESSLVRYSLLVGYPWTSIYNCSARPTAEAAAKTVWSGGVYRS